MRGKWIERLIALLAAAKMESSLVRGKWIERYPVPVPVPDPEVFPREREVD